jgi:hypothetical protein
VCVVAFNEQYPGERQQNIANYFHGVHPSVGTVLEIFLVRKGIGKMRYKSLKWSKRAKLKELENVSVI